MSFYLHQPMFPKSKLLWISSGCPACLTITFITFSNVFKYKFKYRIQTQCVPVSAYHFHNCSPRLQLSKCQSEINGCWTWRFESFMPHPYYPLDIKSRFYAAKVIYPILIHMFITCINQSMHPFLFSSNYI